MLKKTNETILSITTLLLITLFFEHSTILAKNSHVKTGKVASIRQNYTVGYYGPFLILDKNAVKVSQAMARKLGINKHIPPRNKKRERKVAIYRQIRHKKKQKTGIQFSELAEKLQKNHSGFIYATKSSQNKTLFHTIATQYSLKEDPRKGLSVSL